MICFRCFQLWSTLTLCDHVFKQTPSGHAVCNLALRSHIIHKHLSNYTTWKTTKADTSVSKAKKRKQATLDPHLENVKIDPKELAVEILIKPTPDQEREMDT